MAFAGTPDSREIHNVEERAFGNQQFFPQLPDSKYEQHFWEDILSWKFENTSEKVEKPSQKPKMAKSMSDVTREEISAQLAAAKAERSAEMAALHLDMERQRSETALALERLRAESQTAFADLRGDLKGNSEALRADFQQMITAVTKETSRVAEGIAEARGSVDGLKTTVNVMLALLGIVIAAAALWVSIAQLNQPKETTPASPVSQQQPARPATTSPVAATPTNVPAASKP